MFEQLGIDVGLWSNRFRESLDWIIGDAGVLKGPLIAFVAIVIVGYVVAMIGDVAGVLFGIGRSRLRMTQVSFGRSGSVWASREDVDRLEWGQYQRVGRPVESSTYVSIDSDDRELSRVTVTRWSGD